MRGKMVIKKIGIILGIGGLLMGVSACGKAEPEKTETTTFEENGYVLRVNNVGEFDVKGDYQYQEETDWDWSYLNAHTMSNFVKVGNTYYVRLADYVYICDFEQGRLIPLCNRPNCLHNRETDETKKEDCAAYVGLANTNEGLQYYEGNLYANSSYHEWGENSDELGDALYKLTLDGSSKEILDYKFQDLYNFRIHRGNIYYTSLVSDPETMANTETMYCCNIKSKEQTQIAQVQGTPTFDIRPYGDYVYITVALPGDTPEPGIIYETETGKTKVLEDWEQFYFPDAGKFLSCKSTGENRQAVETVNLDGSGKETIGEIVLEDLEQFGFEDGSEQRLSSWFSADNLYLYLFGAVDGQPVAAIFDRENFELMQLLSLESDPIYQCIGVDDTNLFYMCDQFYSGENKVYWMKKEDMLKPGAAFSVMEP